MRTLLLLVVCLPVVCFADYGHLCRGDEQIVFGCQVDKKIISICGSRDFTSTTGYVQYRFGTANKLELEYPKEPAPSHDLFWASHAMYSGGGETRVRFENRGVEYLVYDAMYRTRYDGGPNEPNMPRGVFITIKGKERIDKVCTDDGGFRTEHYLRLDQEAFDYDKGANVAPPSSDSGSNVCGGPVKIESSTETPAGPERTRLTFEWSDLAAGPPWQPGKGGVPLSPAKAIALAKATFGSEARNLSLQSMTLYSTQCQANGPYWYYQLSVGIRDSADALVIRSPQLVVVLLSGKVVRAIRVNDGT